MSITERSNALNSNRKPADFRSKKPIPQFVGATEELPSKHKKETSVISLQEYRDTFSYIYSLYGIDKRAAKIGFLESMMMLRSAIGQLTGPIFNRSLRGVFVNSPNDRVEDTQSFLKDARKLAMVASGTVAGFLSATLIDGAARKSFEKETLSFRAAINDRVAHSIFMRDLEFIQDKTPAEVLNIIDRGKRGTMTLIRDTYTEVIPHLTSIVAASGAGFGVSREAGVLGLLRLPTLYLTNKKVIEHILTDKKAEMIRKDAIDTRVMTSLQSIEVVKASDTIENAIDELTNTMREQDEIVTESQKKHITRNQQESYFNLLFEEIVPMALGYKDFTELIQKQNKQANSGLSALQQYRTIASLERSVGWHASALMRIFSERIQPALVDIKQMESLLGPYELLDKPNGLQEQVRVPVTALQNFDIHIHNLNFKNILHNVSLDIPEGAFVTIKGQSGIGKTTLLRHMLGLFGSEKGQVQYGGIDLGSIKKYGEQSIYSRLAYANQNPQYFENMTLRENLQLWTTKPVTDETLVQVLRDLRLEYMVDRMNSTMKHFSGGELRRIGIARALLKDPKVLFLDEPTSNLDQESAKQVLEIIKEMRRKRPDMTVVAVTHDPNFEVIAEQIVDMREINQPASMEALQSRNRPIYFVGENGEVFKTRG
jgi:ABC-type transport system involved in cytochrome bd biosynthesis fused ATPase/permease subunit